MRHITELDRDEQIKAIQGNHDLLDKINEVCTGYFSPAYCRVDEYLHNFPNNGDYEIDGAYGGYVNLGADYEAIADYLEEVNNDFDLFYDIDNARVRIAYIKRYAEILNDSDSGYITIQAKDYDYMENYIRTTVALFEKTLLELCNEEYRYFEDINNCIDYYEEMEYFENIYVTEANEIVDLDSIQIVLNENNIFWDIETIRNIIEKIGEGINI